MFRQPTAQLIKPGVVFELTPEDIEEIRQNLSSGGFELRNEQLGFINAAFPGHLVDTLAAPTSAGKTLMFLSVALPYLRRGFRVVMLTTQQHLVNQILHSAEQLPSFKNSRLLAVSGKVPAARRAALYRELPQLIVATRETVLNDINAGRWEWNGIGLIGRDECHHGQGRDAYAQLSPLLSAEGVRQILLSALPAKNRQALQQLLFNTGSDQPLVLESTRKVTEQIVVPVQLPERLLESIAVLREESSKIWGLIKEKLDFYRTERGSQSLTLFDYKPLPEAAVAEVRHAPTFAERESALKEICSLKDPDNKELLKEANKLHSLWAQHGLIVWLEHVLATTGRFNFLEDFAYRHTWHRFDGKIKIPEIDEEKRTGPRFFELNVLRNARIWAVFCELAEGTPYFHLINQRQWDKAHRAAFRDLDLAGMSRQEIAQSFFDLAMDEMTRKYPYDHPKLQSLVTIITEHQEVFSGGRGIVFTETRRHARFLKKFVNEVLGQLGIKARYAAGTGIASERAERVKALAAFNSGEANLLISTDFAREGIDVRRAKLGIEYVMPNSSPIKRIQGRGRLGREEGLSFTRNYLLVTRGCEEERKPEIATARENRMRAVLRLQGVKVKPAKLENGSLTLFEQ